jgi:hypothetical protein
MANGKLSYEACESIYGGGRVASQITGGVLLTGGSGEDSFYNLNNGYGATTSSLGVTMNIIASGTVGGPAGSWTGVTVGARTAAMSVLDADRLVRFDPELSGSDAAVGVISASLFDAAQWNSEDAVSIVLGTDNTNPNRLLTQVRRLTRPDFRNNQLGTDNLLFVAASSVLTSDQLTGTLVAANTASFVIAARY